MSVKAYQEKLKDLLSVIIDEKVVPEWRTKMDAGLYSPRVDVAVGPFGMEAGHDCIPKYDGLFETNQELMLNMVQQHLENLAIDYDVEQKMNDLRWTNPNSRCFIAIEIENRSSRKHLMG